MVLCGNIRLSKYLVDIVCLVNIGRSDIESIHLATMEVLEDVGVKFCDKIALHKLASVSADVDYEKQITKFAQTGQFFLSYPLRATLKALSNKTF